MALLALDPASGRPADRRCGSSTGRCCWRLCRFAASHRVLLAARPRPRTGRERSRGALTGIALVLGVLALADPRIGPGPRADAVLAVDGSASIDSHRPRSSVRCSGSRGQTDCQAPCRIIRFGANANASPANQGVTIDRSATNLQDGIAAAIGLAPAGGRVVVLSDGAQTDGRSPGRRAAGAGPPDPRQLDPAPAEVIAATRRSPRSSCRRQCTSATACRSR